MRIKSIAIDFKRTKNFKREVGIHCIVYNMFLFRLWLLDDTLIEMIKKSHNAGLKEARQIFKN